MHALYVCRVDRPEFEEPDLYDDEERDSIKSALVAPVEEWVDKYGDENNWYAFCYALVKDGQAVSLSGDPEDSRFSFKKMIKTETNMIKFAKKLRYEDLMWHGRYEDKFPLQEYLSSKNPILKEIAAIRSLADKIIESKAKTLDDLTDYGSGMWDLRKLAGLLSLEPTNFPFTYGDSSPYASHCIDLSSSAGKFSYVVVDIHT